MQRVQFKNTQIAESILKLVVVYNYFSHNTSLTFISAINNLLSFVRLYDFLSDRLFNNQRVNVIQGVITLNICCLSILCTINRVRLIYFPLLIQPLIFLFVYFRVQINYSALFKTSSLYVSKQEEDNLIVIRKCEIIMKLYKGSGDNPESKLLLLGILHRLDFHRELERAEIVLVIKNIFKTEINKKQNSPYSDRVIIKYISFLVQEMTEEDKVVTLKEI